MSAAIDRTCWARRPHPRTLEQLVDIARRSGHPLHARVRLEGGWADVFLHGSTVLHAQAGWALGRRALVRICGAEPFARAHLQHHGTPAAITIDRAWPQLRAELSWAMVPRRHPCLGQDPAETSTDHWARPRPGATPSRFGIRPRHRQTTGPDRGRA